jgi:O-antigen/teichoic acid export membrane protein
MNRKHSFASMQKKFFGNLLFLLFLNLMVKPFWILGIDRAVQNHVGYEAYGEYFALFNFSFLLNIFLDLGLTNYNNRNVAQSHVMFHKYLGTLLRLKLWLGIVYAVLTLVLGLALGYDSKAFELMGLLALNQFLISFILFLRSNLSGLFLFKTDSIMSVLDRCLLILFVGFLLYFDNGSLLTIRTFIMAQTLAYALVVVVLLIILFRIRESISTKVKNRFSIAVVKQSLPFALLVLLMTLYTKTDAVMLERMLLEGKLYTGIYAQGYRLLEALNMIAFLFSTLLLPTFSRMLKNRVPVASLCLSASKLLSVFAFGAALIAFLFKEPIISAMYPNAVDRSYEIFPMLLLCIIPISGTYVYGTLLTAAGNLKWLNMMAIGGLMLNVLLNVLLIPRFDVMGAVVATIITQFATFFVQLYLSKDHHRLFSAIGVLVKQSGIVAVVFLAHYGLSTFLGLWWCFVLDALLYVGISVGLKQVELKYFWQMLRSREQAV